MWVVYRWVDDVSHFFVFESELEARAKQHEIMTRALAALGPAYIHLWESDLLAIICEPFSYTSPTLSAQMSIVLRLIHDGARLPVTFADIECDNTAFDVVLQAIISANKK